MIKQAHEKVPHYGNWNANLVCYVDLLREYFLMSSTDLCGLDIVWYFIWYG